MQKARIISMLILFFGAYAQVDPTFEQEGNKVKVTYFHANGEISQQGNFLNEKLEGEWKMFNENGDKIAMGNYDNGIKTRKWLFWEGDVKKEVNFDNSRIASATNAKTKEPIAVNK